MINSNAGWITFQTSMGICGISWNAYGIASFHLPEASGVQIEKLLKKISGNVHASSSLPLWIKEIIRKVKAHLRGNPQDFSDAPLHLNGVAEFRRSVYKAAQKIPSGKVMTYAELAKTIGRPRAARAVGTALAKNPIPLIIPCHRIISSSGKLGGFSASGGLGMKAAILACEKALGINDDLPCFHRICKKPSAA